VKTFVDANISISPNGVNRVGQNHVFTAHVNVNDGSGGGFVSAPAGTQISFSIDSGPGSFSTPNPCTVVAAGSCQVTLTSASTGVTTVSAHVTLSVGGVSLTRNTNGTDSNSGPATKTWVNARIHIAPNATNAVGQPHTFTVTLERDTGNGLGFQPAQGEHVDVALTDSGGAVHTAPTGSCTTAGPNTDANGQCTITFTSNSAGTVTGHATSTLSVAGSAPFTVQTNGVAPNGPDAVKTYVDANIQISPAQATNPVGANHVLTITVNAINGTIDAGPHTATASIVSGPGSFVGSPTCTYTGGAATASCTVTITSSTPGTTVVQATSNIPVNGVVIPRTTATNPGPGGSGNANKNWVKVKITIAPDATNEINHPHTFTVTVFEDTGSGYQPVPMGTDCEITLTGLNGAVPSVPPLITTTNGSGQCSITFTSATPGEVTGHGKSTLSIGGQVVTDQTDATGDNSRDADKWFVDANISISPASAINPVNNTHTLTAHVNVNNGTGAGYVNAPDNTTITFAFVGSHVGSFVGGVNQCTTTAGSCSVQTTSSTPGTDTVSASVTLLAGPTGAGFPPQVSLTRTTNNTAGNSAPAQKNWADDSVVTTVLDAGNLPVNVNQVASGTVVHDSATVSKLAGTPASVPNPTGTVSFTLYDNGTCNGNVVATDPNKPLAGGVATSATFTTPAAGGTFSYFATYNGDANYPIRSGACEPFTVSNPFGPALTPGFWKNHEAATTALLPITLGNYVVNTFPKARAIFDAMKCSSPIDCLAGHELAAKLDLKSGSNPSITPVIAQADALLIAVNYNGPGNFTPPTDAQKALALQLEVLIDAYTNQ
jgi:hypothetical protein